MADAAAFLMTAGGVLILVAYHLRRSHRLNKEKEALISRYSGPGGRS